MKKIVALLMLMMPVLAFSQATSATAVITTPVAYFDATPGVPATTNHNLVASSGQTFPSCAGNQNVFWFKFNIPVPTLTTNSTKSVKITLSGSSFTPTIDFFDASVTWKECITGSILRTNPTTNPVVPGQDYYVRISSATGNPGDAFTFGVEYYPVSELNPSFTPAPDADGYNICQQIRRALVATTGVSLVQATRIRLVPTTTPNNGECTATVSGTTTILQTSAFPCACYGINFDAYVELMVDGVWCGEGVPKPANFQTAPTTNITTTTLSTINFDTNINCTPCGTSTYQWRFTTSNGAPIIQNTSSGLITLTTGICIQFNKIYQCEVRMISCGVTGPWCGITGAGSAPLTFFTPSFPNVIIPSVYCNATLPTNALIDVPFIDGVTNYLFQFVPVTSTPPYNPTGPAQIVNNTTSAAFIAQGQANTPGNYYRVAAKGLSISCGQYQQGNWSPFCYYAVAPAAAPNASVLEPEDVTVATVQTESITEEENQANASVLSVGSQRILSVDLKENTMLRNGYLRLYDTNGQLIYIEQLPLSTGVSMVQTDLPTDLATGIYIVHVTSDSYSTFGKCLINQ